MVNVCLCFVSSGGEEEAPGFEAERVWGNWMSARDPDSGAEYFFNQETGKAFFS